MPTVSYHTNPVPWLASQKQFTSTELDIHTPERQTRLDTLQTGQLRKPCRVFNELIALSKFTPF